MHMSFNPCAMQRSNDDRVNQAHSNIMNFVPGNGCLVVSGTDSKNVIYLRTSNITRSNESTSNIYPPFNNLSTNFNFMRGNLQLLFKTVVVVNCLCTMKQHRHINLHWKFRCVTTRRGGENSISLCVINIEPRGPAFRLTLSLLPLKSRFITDITEYVFNNSISIYNHLFTCLYDYTKTHLLTLPSYW